MVVLVMAVAVAAMLLLDVVTRQFCSSRKRRSRPFRLGNHDVDTAKKKKKKTDGSCGTVRLQCRRQETILVDPRVPPN